MPRIDLRIDPMLLQDAAGQILKGAQGYPPFDVAWFPEEPNGVFLKITVAVAGFHEEELDVVTENNILEVSGYQKERETGEFLYRGIAGRQFRRRFALMENMEVIRARLERGLLEIDIARKPGEVRKINISVSK